MPIDRCRKKRSVREDVAADARRMKRRLFAAAAISTCACLSTGACCAEPALSAGFYELASRMSMPHLDDMRRIVTTEQRCLGADDLQALFPVLRQPALTGCKFDFPQPLTNGTRYVLVCASARVATGTADLTPTPTGVIGELAVKMGGKNMTFTQRVEARRIDAECPAATGSPAQDVSR